MTEILNRGAAGYIDSDLLKWLAQRGHAVTVLDNLSTGHREAVRWGEFVDADLLDPASLARVVAGDGFDCVTDLCARPLVRESVA